jgi:tRNA pseudouridine32 synthase/23S rRNA pseudouridine746 synthase
MPDTIPILYQDDSLLIVDKPSGLLTVPGRGPEKQDCLINRLLIPFPNARIVHRLDQATSGIVIIALSHPAQKGMGQLFEKRAIQKSYGAVVEGIMAKDRGSVDLPLICDWPNRPRQIVDHENGKQALTHYEVLKRNRAENHTRVLLKPVTGRSHQLRVHMQALGHSILGDGLYATGKALEASSRLLLHAATIDFVHPISAEAVSIQSPYPF